MTKTKKNLIYQGCYQILIIILPIITAPYVSRVLGTEGVGEYSYSYSVVNYFVIFAMLGINNYGNKLIAVEKKNQKSLNKAFSNLYMLHAIISIMVIATYFVYVLMSPGNKEYALLSSFYLFGALLDINWLFWGLEELKITVIRNTILRIVTIMLVFIFVKNSDDTGKYIFILAMSNCLSQVILWREVARRIQFVKPTLNEMKIHFKPLCVLFVPVIAVSCYKIMDKIMINSLADVNQVGLYENAEKIINIPMGLITAVGTVMLPKAASLVRDHNENAVKRCISVTMKYVMILAIALMYGLMAIAKDFSIIFFGNIFSGTGIMIFGLAITIPFMSFANIIRTQYLIPKDYNSIFIGSVCAGAVVNVIANRLLIPIYLGNGAVIGTVLAEFTVFIIQVIAVHNEIPTFKYLFNCLPYTVIGLVMFASVRGISLVMNQGVLLLLIQVIVGMIIYGSLTIYMLLKTKDDIFVNCFNIIKTTCKKN